jgi:CHAT domain-containing protein
LPGSEAEVNAIKGFFPESTLALRAEATRAKFLTESIKAGFVHAAAHVTLDELDPMQSALKLSGFGKESGDVVAGDFLKLDLSQVKLVTLSACNSGIGRIAPGDEFYGFKRSILLSGARSLALTYWAVDDDATSELMTQFYRHLREGRMPAHMALQKAQSEMMAIAKFAEPYHWASFMLVGTF